MAAIQGSASPALPEQCQRQYEHGNDDDGIHTASHCGVSLITQLAASPLQEEQQQQHQYVAAAESGLLLQKREVQLNLTDTELRIGPPSSSSSAAAAAAAAAVAAAIKHGGTAPPTTSISANLSEQKQQKQIQMKEVDIQKEEAKFTHPSLGTDFVPVTESFLSNTNSAEKAAAKDGETTVFPHYHNLHLHLQLPSSFSPCDDVRAEKAGNVGSFSPFKSPRPHTLNAHADHISDPRLNKCLSHSKAAPPSAGGSSDAEQANQSSLRDDSKRGPVGWPPVQSFRKNTLPASHSQSAAAAAREDKRTLAPADAAAICSSSHLVKVYMDGLQVGRKVDLKIHNTYHKLSATLEEMFQRFLNASREVSGQKWVMKNPNYCGRKKLNFLCGSEYVIAYEDKDGDLMLMGDVPWGIFEGTVKRLRIMKGYEAIGLAPRAPEKSRNCN